MRLLLVEDDLMLGKTICQGLRLENYVVGWVQQGREAALAIRHEPYAGYRSYSLADDERAANEVTRTQKARLQQFAAAAGNGVAERDPAYGASIKIICL